jgi:hypothetical protein
VRRELRSVPGIITSNDVALNMDGVDKEQPQYFRDDPPGRRPSRAGDIVRSLAPSSLSGRAKLS